jgi:hypothetical protein
MKGKRDQELLLSKNPGMMQSASMSGIFKGIVVNVKDPGMLGRVQVYCYSLHRDMRTLSIKDLPWAEVIQPLRGAFSPPEINDRVVVSFEAGDKYAPIVLGYWNAIPMGRGTLPYSAKVGTDVRPEAWPNRGGYPEANLICCSGAGNAIWFEDKILDDNLASVLQLEDTGGKIIRAKSYHIGYSGFASIEEYDGNKGGMLNANADVHEPARDGITPAEPVVGSIELRQQNVQRIMHVSDETFSADQLTQYDSREEVGITQQAVSGEIHRTRQGMASVSMVGDALSLLGRTVMCGPLLSPPRKW